MMPRLRLLLAAIVLAACGLPAATPSPVAPMLTAAPATTATLAATHTSHAGPAPTATVEASNVLATAAATPSVAAEAGFIVPGAAALNMAAGPGELVYVLAAHGEALQLYRSTDGGDTFAQAALVSQGDHAEVLAVVRPALAVGAAGLLGAAWVDFPSPGQARVRAAFSTDDGEMFSAPATLTTTSDPETTMASLAFDAAGRVWVAWLQDSTLRLAVADGPEAAFGPPQVLDDLVCECCQPAPLAADERVYVAYRNLVRDAAGVASRDIHVADVSGGAVGQPVRVSDGAWHIDACPIAGPALAEREGVLYAAWMDGRFDDGTLSRTDIWLAASHDGGASFGPNTRINAAQGAYNGAPALALDADGRLHVAWAADTPEGQAVLYATSSNGGATFAPAVALPGTGRRLGSVVVAVTAGGRVLVGWADSAGGHVATP